MTFVWLYLTMTNEVVPLPFVTSKQKCIRYHLQNLDAIMIYTITTLSHEF